MKSYLEAAGFVDVTVTLKPESREIIKNWVPGSGAENYVLSANIEAIKPGGARKKVSATADPVLAPPRLATEPSSTTCCPSTEPVAAEVSA